MSRVQSLKKDPECLRWTRFKVPPLVLGHVSAAPWAFSIFSVELMNVDVDKVSLQAHYEK